MENVEQNQKQTSKHICIESAEQVDSEGKVSILFSGLSTNWCQRKGISVNLIGSEKDEAVQKQIEQYFGKSIVELQNDDPEALEKALKNALKS